jgi:hypothetical protein
MSVANKALEQDKEIPEGDDGSFVILENVTSQKSGEEDDWMVTNKASMDKALHNGSPNNHPETIICNPPGNQHQSICQSCSKGDSQCSL